MLKPAWPRAVVVLLCGAAINGAAVAQNAPARHDGAPTFSAPSLGPGQALTIEDAATLRAGLAAARRGDAAAAQAAREALTHPIARKLVMWAMIDVAPDQLSFFELDQARRDLWGWPRSAGRQAAAEDLLETSGLTPLATIAWLEGSQPQSAPGAMALAAAYRAAGRSGEAKALVRKAWREMTFDDKLQRTMLERFGGDLTTEDHIARLDTLLYGGQSAAADEMLSLVPADYQQLAAARTALRQGAANALAIAAQVPQSLSRHPGLIFERARLFRSTGQETAALALVSGFPKPPPGGVGAKRVWQERWALFSSAMRAQRWAAAYAALQDHGLGPGSELADAEFFAGWLALSKMGDPVLADRHFGRLQAAGSSPITLGRAYYWRGRAAEARGDSVSAAKFYELGARFYTAFYGQLSMEKTGQARITLSSDPVINAADRARFEGRELVQAARLLTEAGEKTLFRVFVLALDDSLPNAQESALLVDLARGYGDQDLAMRVVRTAAQRGFVLPERGYPLRPAPQAGSAEPALVLGIVRQESGFDPKVRSGVGARGMMQLMPGTAAIVARQLGVSYSADMLDDPDYNMRLGSAYISEMVDEFGGSYILAAAAYNAGPGRPPQWVAACGDPRSEGFDPADFIECIPFSETRNYVMRVLEGMQVYRARINGGTARLTPSADLKRGKAG